MYDKMKQQIKIWKFQFSLFDYGVAILIWFLTSFIEWGSPLVSLPLPPFLIRFIDTIIPCLFFPIIFDLAVLIENRIKPLNVKVRFFLSLFVGLLSIYYFLFTPLVGRLSDRILNSIGLSDRISDLMVETFLMAIYAFILRTLLNLLLDLTIRQNKGRRRKK